MDVLELYPPRKNELPSIYFSHEREVLEFEGQFVALSEFIRIDETDTISRRSVRYRTVGDMTCTAAVESSASTIDDSFANHRNKNK
jgi:sulfate adenylyltransferase subunit 2